MSSPVGASLAIRTPGGPWRPGSLALHSASRARSSTRLPDRAGPTRAPARHPRSTKLMPAPGASEAQPAAPRQALHAPHRATTLSGRHAVYFHQREDVVAAKRANDERAGGKRVAQPGAAVGPDTHHEREQ